MALSLTTIRKVSKVGKCLTVSSGFWTISFKPVYNHVLTFKPLIMSKHLTVEISPGQ